MTEEPKEEPKECAGCSALAARLAEHEELLLIYRENAAYHRQVIQGQQQRIEQLQAERDQH